MQKQIFSSVKDVDLNNLNPRQHNDCWVVADSRKWHGCLRKGSLMQDGAIFSEVNSLKMADELNTMIYKNTFGAAFGTDVVIKGPFYAYRLYTAKQLGLL